MAKQRLIEIGTRFGSLTTTSSTYLIVDRPGHRRSRVRCICDCGQRREYLTSNVTSGKSTSCGRCVRVVLPEVGDTVGEWTLLRREGSRALCRCSCGTEKDLYVYSLQKDSRSCGHAHRNDGRRRAKLRRIWQLMHQRCYVSEAIGFSDYGARGITISEPWLSSFGAFYEWSIENGYQMLSGLQIDRIDYDGPYAPDNCRWVDRWTNARNKRNTRMLTAFGETRPLPEWIEDPRVDNSYSLVHSRVMKGWDHEQALTVPPYGKHGN